MTHPGPVKGATADGPGGVSVEVDITIPIGLTLNQILDLADEAELRAQTLSWMSDCVRPSSSSPHKARSLLQIAAELRRKAEHLLTEDRLATSSLAS